MQAFLQPSFSSRPTLDLNAYFILALNNEPNISVIDPLSGFGGSKLYTLIPLKSPGEDWVLTEDNKRLYVSMPQMNQVAVIDIPTLESDRERRCRSDAHACRYSTRRAIPLGRQR